MSSLPTCLGQGRRLPILPYSHTHFKAQAREELELDLDLPILGASDISAVLLNAFYTLFYIILSTTL